LGLAAQLVSSAQADADRPGLPRAVGALRAQLRDPIQRRVVGVVLVGAALAGIVAFGLAGHGSVLRGLGVPAAALLPGLTVLSCLAEMTVVRLRHGEAVEELSLYEAALIIDVLLLPPRDALIAAAAGLVLASALQRRPVVKAVFNLGTYTAATAVLILIVHLLGGRPGEMTLGVLVGVVVGTLAFTGVNLLCLAQILGVLNKVAPWRIVRSEARLSAYMAVGTMVTGLTTTEIALHSPLLLPFMAMPALAVTYAYRAAAREADEHARSACLLQLSHALAEREDVVRQFLVLVREAFGADLAVVVLENDDTALSVESTDPTALRTGPIPRHLATLGRIDGPVHLAEDLPGGLRRMVVVPVQGGGRRFGTAAFATRDRSRGWMTTGDVTLLASLASALAVAMRGAEHLDRLVDETSKLQAVVEQSAEGIMVIDGDGTVQVWSRALADITGVDAAEATGRPLATVLDVPVEEERRLLMPVSVEQPKAVAELTARRRDGEQRRLRLAHSAVFTAGLLVRDVVVISDLTREYRTERLKSDFIAMVSHELRTPLTPIIGYVDLLRSRGERMTPQKRLDALNLIGDRAGHLSRLVEDLLLASRFGDNPDDVSLQVSAGTHDLCALATQAARDLGSARVVLDLPPGPVLAHCDDGRALQVLANLIGNGLKYSAEETEVAIGMRLDGTRVHVDVRDHGRGIPADQLAKVFDKFHRVEDPMTMSTSGTGLGLFIARRLARAMGGDVTVVSTLNSGSVFTLSLTRANAEPPAE
ncbi:ATP-binding protein, partial [Actinoplanes sp. NPDC048791]|uniref:sensor histidine kinase n=1 Tax=Actinoplanes sp. NPDC048791 TaxID=3154623 RepID=UPI0033EA9D11